MPFYFAAAVTAGTSAIAVYCCSLLQFVDVVNEKHTVAFCFVVSFAPLSIVCAVDSASFLISVAAAV